MFGLQLTLDRYTITGDDKIRGIADPETVFKYRINRNERFNVKKREAMDGIFDQYSLLGPALTVAPTS
jgi:hypothetical protein